MLSLYRVAVVLVSLFVGQLAHAKPPAEWQFQEWRDAVAKAESEKKPLLILFGFEDCQWCDYLYRRGMNDANLRSKYQQAAALTYFDTKNTNQAEQLTLPGGATVTRAEIMQRFQAYPTPSWVFISPSGEVLQTNRSGKSTSREMLRDLEAALSKK
jgi:thioredoxin-related protein